MRVSSADVEAAFEELFPPNRFEEEERDESSSPIASLPDSILGLVLGAVDSQRARTRCGLVSRRFRRLCAELPLNPLFVSASANAAMILWDAVSWERLYTFNQHFAQVSDCCFSPDGRLLASCSYDCTVRIWDVATGEEQLSLKGHTTFVNACCFSADGSYVISASGTLMGEMDNSLRVWDVRTAGEKFSLCGHARPVRCCACSPRRPAGAEDDITVSGSQDHTLKVWSLATGRELATLEAHDDAVTCCSFSPDGTVLVSGSSDCTLRVWSVATWQETHVLAGHFVYDVGCMCKWPTRNFQGPVHLLGRSGSCTLSGHSLGILCCSFSPDGKALVSGSEDMTIKVWRLDKSGAWSCSLLAHSTAASKLSFSPSGRWIGVAPGPLDETNN
eukprot:gene10874-12870_t